MLVSNPQSAKSQGRPWLPKDWELNVGGPGCNMGELGPKFRSGPARPCPPARFPSGSISSRATTPGSWDRRSHARFWLGAQADPAAGPGGATPAQRSVFSRSDNQLVEAAKNTGATHPSPKLVSPPERSNEQLRLRRQLFDRGRLQPVRVLIRRSLRRRTFEQRGGPISPCRGGHGFFAHGEKLREVSRCLVQTGINLGLR